MKNAMVISGYAYTRDADGRYLEALERGYSRSRAEVNSGYSTLSMTVRAENDQEWVRLVNAAMLRGKDHTLDRVNDMLESGVRKRKVKRVVDPDGFVVGNCVEEVISEQDIDAAIKVAKIHNPEKFVEHVQAEVVETRQVSQSDIENAAKFALRLMEMEKVNAAGKKN